MVGEPNGLTAEMFFSVGLAVQHERRRRGALLETRRAVNAETRVGHHHQRELHFGRADIQRYVLASWLL